MDDRQEIKRDSVRHSSQLQHTPPLIQIVISFFLRFCSLSEGKNQKNNLFCSSFLSLMGNNPAYDSPASYFTSGMAVPLTANSAAKCSCQQVAHLFAIVMGVVHDTAFHGKDA